MYDINKEEFLRRLQKNPQQTDTMGNIFIRPELTIRKHHHKHITAGHSCCSQRAQYGFIKE